MVRPPGPLIVPDKVALLPLVSMVPPWLCNVTGKLLVILAPAICKVPPVNTGPDAPLGPEASVQASAPEVFALKVSPEASSALPFEQMPSRKGMLPAGMGAPTTVLVAVSMTETLPLALLVT